jgi:predicted lipoprotein with Yx(FWY)xxD motif
MKAFVLLLCLPLLGCGATTTPTASEPEASASPAVRSPSSAPSSPAASTAPPTPTRAVPKPAAPQSRSTPTSTGTTIIAAGSQFGTILYDDSGQAIYLFDREGSTRPECYDDCARAWPPVLTDGKPRAKGRIQDDLLGTTGRTDGSTQVTYDGHPLYFYADEGKYEVLCHDIEGFGGTWLAIQPDGKPAPH